MTALFKDPIDMMPIDDVVAAVKRRCRDDAVCRDEAVVHHYADGRYAIIRQGYAAVGAPSRLSDWCLTENDAWRSALRGGTE